MGVLQSCLGRWGFRAITLRTVEYGFGFCFLSLWNMSLDVHERIKSQKSLSMKIKIVDEVIRGPKHKVPKRTALFDPKTAELLTD